MIEGTHRSLVRCFLTVNSAMKGQAKIATVVEHLAVIMMEIIKNSIQKGAYKVYITALQVIVQVRSTEYTQ